MRIGDETVGKDGHLLHETGGRHVAEVRQRRVLWAGWMVAVFFAGLWLEASRWLGSLAAWGCGG